MDIHFKYKYDDLFNPTLKALKNLGNSGSTSEIEDEVIKILNLSEDSINEIHRESTTKLAYRLAWARNYLKKYGLVENSSRGIWALTENGQKNNEVNKDKVKKFVVKKDKEERLEKSTKTKDSNIPNIEEITEEIEEFSWQDKLLETIRNIEPSQFERLCQRLLRELGFINVEVTGKTNDGGIDGKGILKIGQVLSFHVVFQAKRYQGTVSSSVIRDFRGAMDGRAEKGLIMTTGNFSREARKEAQRDGAKQIDLIDGNEFAEKLKDLRLGVNIELVEEVKIKNDWFRSL
ncbi:restriction system protein [Chishuiella changwenlii]|uniref:Restriction system protein n=1 Tax=Chishuiella changwenlii TaxID=1434701 RepID=A0A1M6WAQ1_9FLAO|nr:restriction endonuclease [Chishuiella changwenlii]GGF05387.1 mrr restriction system protein [Chishuiella changwenlii]SHK90853.1 restriction system protein [Chishuiella changwenlii]